uniref:Prominin 2 n=1 Tax=Cyclopterus lumpus TaxID=8103 RepID=A0A8C2Z0F9_CYCLU
MGFCESVKARRGQGSAATVVLLLRLSLAQSVPPHTVCPAAAAPHSLTQPQYQHTEEDASVGFMAALVQSFLHTVQPNPFPKDMILKIVKNFEIQLNQEIINEALVYEVGFVVCAAIGVLYIVLMPIVGLLLACCRCCGNCGGKMYQEQTSSTQCRRRTLYWTGFVTTVILLAGNICMFKSNEAIKVSVDQSQLELNKSINNIQSFLTVVPQQFDYVVNESYRTIQQVSSHLDDIGPQLGTEIKARIRGTADRALHSVKLLNQDTENTNLQLEGLNSSLAQLQSSMDHLQANFTAVKNRINSTLSNQNCSGCNTKIQTLTLDTSITIPSLNEFQSAMDGINRADLKSKIIEVEGYFNSIPQSVTNATKDVVQSSKRLLGNIKTQISQVTNDIPLSALTNVSEKLNLLQREISKVAPDVERVEHIRWGVCVALCCVVLLVVVCNFLGLVLGPLGLTPKANPTNRSCTADCGGTFLMIGAGLSFLFSWLFMIAVLLLFQVGGNVYTLLCRPWSDGQLLKLIDTPGAFPGLDIGATLGLKTNINISDIYRDCEQNQPVWTTLHLYELINLEDLLNVTKYTEQMQQQFEDANITLSGITILTPEDKNLLRQFSSNATNIDSTAVTQQMNNISSINLNKTADILDLLATFQVSSINMIHIAFNSRLFLPVAHPLLFRLFQGTVEEVLSNVGAVQDFLKTNMTQIVKTESRMFVNCQLGYFINYANWANVTITQQVGRCRPVAGAVDSAEIILCSYIVETLNAFWFSLGWCMIFFIPSIIFSIKLAKYYRRMKFSDLIMHHIPRAQMKIP